MNNITVPQIKNPWINALIIFVAIPLSKFGAQYYAGTLHHWSDITLSAISDETFHSFWTVVAWIFLRSPWSSAIRQLTSESELTAEDGSKMALKKTVTLEQSPPPEEKKN